jgi:excisionase family DNA binding protein
MTQAREPNSDKEWISVHEASVLIGVSPATLRRWSDAGEIRAFTTPGGHRRFARSAILGLLPAGRTERPSLERLGETPVRMIRVYRRHLADTCFGLLWVQELDESERREFRLLGRRIAGALLDAIDALTPEAQAPALDEATKVAAEFGRLAALCRVDAQQTVEAFLRFRLPFLRELAAVARRRGLDIGEATDLLETAIETIDRLLGALLAGHGAPAPVSASLRGETS